MRSRASLPSVQRLQCIGVYTLFAAAVPFCVTMTIGQQPEVVATGVSPLGVRQQRVERMMEDLERKFKVLAQGLQKTEPERAKRIVKTLQESKQLLIQQRMEEITKLLDKSQLEGASNGQSQVLGDIRKLISLLLDEQNDRDKVREEYERLQEWKKELENILHEERPQKAESERLANKDQTLADLAAQIKSVQELIKQQEAVNAHTKESRGEGIQALERAANQQSKVRTQTEAAADKMAGKTPANSSASEKPSTEGKSPKPPAKSADSKPGDTKAAGEQPSGDKPTGNKSGAGSAGGKSGNEPEKPAADKPPSDLPEKPSGSDSKQPPAPGEKSLRDAAKNQKNAEQNLAAGKGQAGEDDEQRALIDLKRALADLEKDQSRIASLPPEEFKKLADKQNDTAARTGDLQQKMEQASQKAGGDKGDEGAAGGKSGKPSPGQQSLQKSQQKMQDAAGDLGKSDPEEAARNQDKAIKELEKAMQEIEERLAQLREETQLEKLARLEARFREMLARQQVVTKDTREMDLKRHQGELKRSDRLAIAKFAAEEKSIAEAAQQSYDIIYDDGSSVVFPEIVMQVRNDLTSVAQLLESFKVEAYTQSSQQEIELTLQELIDALQKAKQQKEGGGGGGGGSGGGDEPLLPNSAELKLLRLSQLRVNRRTDAFDSTRPKTDLETVLKQEVMNISQRQAEIADMTMRILDRAP